MSFRRKLVLFVARDARSLIALADEALYRAKRDGKNRVALAGRGGVALPGPIGA